jgi:hypothetical protein
LDQERHTSFLINLLSDRKAALTLDETLKKWKEWQSFLFLSRVLHTLLATTPKNPFSQMIEHTHCGSPWEDTHLLPGHISQTVCGDHQAWNIHSHKIKTMTDLLFLKI